MSRIFRWRQAEGPKIEVEGREREWGSWKGDSKPPPLPARGSGEHCELCNGVRGRAPTSQRFFTIFSTRDGLSWDYNIVNCGLSFSHWGCTRPPPHAYAPACNWLYPTTLKFLWKFKYRLMISITVKIWSLLLLVTHLTTKNEHSSTTFRVILLTYKQAKAKNIIFSGR